MVGQINPFNFKIVAVKLIAKKSKSIYYTYNLIL